MDIADDCHTNIVCINFLSAKIDAQRIQPIWILQQLHIYGLFLFFIEDDGSEIECCTPIGEPKPIQP